MSKNRRILTYTGKMFDFLKPEPEMICIEDIAHALACTNRYGGHTIQPYSVAEHCVRASYLVVDNPILNLMHDSAEAYIADIPSPQKNGLKWQFNSGGFGWFGVSYRQVEAEILRNIGKALGIPKLASWLVMPKDVEEADLIMLATEVRDLMPPQREYEFVDWIGTAVPLAEKIKPWSWDEARFKFWRRFEELMK